MVRSLVALFLGGVFLGSAHFLTKQEPTVVDAEAAQERLASGSYSGARAVARADAASAIVKTGEYLAEIQREVKNAEEQASAIKYYASKTGSLINEGESLTQTAEKELKQGGVVQNALGVGVIGWVKRSTDLAGKEAGEEMQAKISALQAWKYEAFHNADQEARKAVYVASLPYEKAAERITTYIGKLRSKAEVVSQDAYFAREQAANLGQIAKFRTAPNSAMGDITKVQALQNEGMLLAQQANNLAKQADDWQLKLVTYERAKDYVAAVAAQRIKPLLTLPPLTGPLPPVGEALVLPDP